MKPLLTIGTDIKIGIRHILGRLHGLDVRPVATVHFVVAAQKYSFLVFILLLLAGQSNATTVVCLMANNRIVIAADSNVTNTDGTVSESCKMGWATIAGIFVSASGVYANQTTNFNVFAMANAAARTGRTVAGTISTFKTMAAPIIVKIVDEARTARPAEYARYLQNVPVIEVVFAHFESGKPILGFVWFVVDKKGSVLPPVHEIRSDKAGVAFRKTMGDYGAIEAEIKAHPGVTDLEITDPLRAGRYYVDIEERWHAAINSKDVGGPISVFDFRNSGARWAMIDGHKQNGKCPDMPPRLVDPSQ